jgi:hypothetical protein
LILGFACTILIHLPLSLPHPILSIKKKSYVIFNARRISTPCKENSPKLYTTLFAQPHRHLTLISTHSTPPTDHSLPAAVPVPADFPDDSHSHTLPVHWDTRPESDYSPDVDWAVAQAVEAVEHNLVADLAVVYHPTAVAAVAGPKVGVVDVGVAVERRIVGVRRVRRGYIGWGCRLRIARVAVGVVEGIAGSCLGGVGYTRSVADRRIAGVT